jgi:hypothetical protein
MFVSSRSNAPAQEATTAASAERTHHPTLQIFQGLRQPTPCVGNHHHRLLQHLLLYDTVPNHSATPGASCCPACRLVSTNSSRPVAREGAVENGGGGPGRAPQRGTGGTAQPRHHIVSFAFPGPHTMVEWGGTHGHLGLGRPGRGGGAGRGGGGGGGARSGSPAGPRHLLLDVVLVSASRLYARYFLLLLYCLPLVRIQLFSCAAARERTHAKQRSE